MTRAAAALFPNSRNKKAPGYGAFLWCRFDLGSLAGKVSFARRDVDRHAVVHEARGGDFRKVERARLGHAVEVPGEFAAVRCESNDFIVIHVHPLGVAGDGDRALGGSSVDRALGGGRLGTFAEKV